MTDDISPLDALLPDAIRQAVTNYRGLAFADVSDDPKIFQQHQAACKAALAHIEALLKLCPAATALPPAPAIAELLASAEAELGAFSQSRSSPLGEEE